MLTCHIMDTQMHSIGKAIRLLFTDPDVNISYLLLNVHGSLASTIYTSTDVMGGTFWLNKFVVTYCIC